jgi:hypothetical protein
MTPEQTSRLESIRHYGTAYEIVIIAPDGSRYLVGYTKRHSGDGLRRMLSRHAERIVSFVGVDSYTLRGRGLQPIDLGAGHRIEFSGRTEREAIISGELPAIPERGTPAPAVPETCRHCGGCPHCGAPCVCAPADPTSCDNHRDNWRK